MKLSNVPCSFCGEIGCLEIRSTNESHFFYGEDIDVEKTFRFCTKCGIEFENTFDHDWKLDLYDEHRKRKNLTTPSQIKSWMENYGLNKHEAANILHQDMTSLERILAGSNHPVNVDQWLLPARLNLSPKIFVGEEILKYKTCFVNGGISPEIDIIYSQLDKKSNTTEFVVVDTYLTSEISGYFRYKRVVSMIYNQYQFVLEPDIDDFWTAPGKIKKFISNIHGPSTIVWDIYGRKRIEYYSINGVQTRLNGPSTIEWNNDGIVIAYCFMKNGENMTDRAKSIMDDWDLPKDFNWNEDERLKFKLSF